MRGEDGRGDGVSRRRMLAATGGALGAFGAVGTTSGEGAEFVEVNVGYRNRNGRAAARRAAADVVREFDFDALTARMPRPAVENLRGRPDVRYVEENATMHALAQTLPWGVDRVDADVAHADGETGRGADVAILDTGIDSDHPDLGANLGEGTAFVTCGSAGGDCRYGDDPNGNECRQPWDDDGDHGTHCAGIADAVDDDGDVVGVATAATLHAVKVLDGCGSGSFSDVAAGIEHVADRGWDVANMSLGASSGSEAVRDACRYAYDRGVLLVAAAGNGGPCTDCVNYPAAYSTVVAVSATTADDALADFSSTGPEVELAAPGETILSTVPPESSSDGTTTFSGTSMACPHVAGAGGQLMANGYTNVEARQRLRETAEDVGLAGTEQGAGLLDVAAALSVDDADASVAVSTGDATDVGTDTATLHGSLDDLGGADSADCYFEYRASGASAWTETSRRSRSSTGSFGETVSGLASDAEYEFRAAAEASDGDVDTGDTTTFTTEADGGSDGTPTVDSYTVTEANSPNPHAEITAEWAVGDADGDLDTVVVEVTDADGNPVDDATTDVGGAEAVGADEFTIKHADGDAFEVTLTVTDAAGNATSATESVTA